MQHSAPEGEDWLYAFLQKDDLDKPYLENVLPVIFIHGHAGDWHQGKHLAYVMGREEFKRHGKKVRHLAACLLILHLNHQFHDTIHFR